MSEPHEDDSEVLQKEEAILFNAVLMWFRFYRVPFDERASDVLCERAMLLYAEGRGQRYIEDHLIRTFSGLIAMRVNAPSSALSH
ncbi:hypothetical protein [Rhizobium leguminosarum]|uniref:Uncharacterized protein n=1 Tax=Rhizobium leguminosarum TaxID=384 RepID=A0A2K9ZEJ0_RHILE|nr:hypothetical protein [Rhizobium leguminosarum]AUW46675.1 hypothetical protein CUJ84_pRLN2000130 [Rhizobium leguminosarum]